MTVLTLDNISLSLSTAGGMVDILRGVSMTLPKGKSVAVVGPSGSGKTSLLMICAGLMRVNHGTVTFDGRDITTDSEQSLSRLRRDRIGIVFQNFHLIPTMTALENVAIPLELGGVANARAQAKEVLGRVKLAHRHDHYPAQLSGGEQQRVAIARALAIKPSLILADEPTGNLDQETGQTIMALLFECVQQYGATLMLITHDPALADRCDQTVHLRDGKVVAA